MSYSGQSNPPWQRNTIGSTGQANMPSISNQMSLQSPSMHYQNQPLFNQNMGISQQSGNQNVPFSQLGGNINQMPATPTPLFSQAVSYPGNRGLNPIAFSSGNNNQQASSGPQQQNQPGTIPKVGDRVFVEATFNQNSPFKLNATRVQIVPASSSGTNVQRNQQPPALMSANIKGSGYNAVPPPNEYARTLNANQRRGPTPPPPTRRSPDRHTTRRDSRHKDDEDPDCKRRRDDKDREKDRPREKRDISIERRDRSPVRRSSPKRRRKRTMPRYMVQIPKISLTVTEADVLELKRRYSSLYIPSDFFFSQIKWSKSFPPDNPFSIQRPCSFHIMHKSVDPPLGNSNIIDPPDVDYLYSAKVMLMGAPPIAEIYQKCLFDERDRDDERDFVHPTRLINFLVGIRGKNETMAIGGPWSPSLDGENPQEDPTVLIKTAIRTCKSLTGIDLSGCTQWYRFVELYYHRAETTHKGRLIPARVETVVIFLPDINSCMPTRIEWDNVQHNYKLALEHLINPENPEIRNSSFASPTALGSNNLAGDGTSGKDSENKASSNPEECGNEKDDGIKREPTHYSQLDLKNMKLQDLRDELSSRNLSCKGLKPQLIARLTKALNTEKAQEDNRGNESEEIKVDNPEDSPPLEENYPQNEDHVDIDMNDFVVLDEYDANKHTENTSKKEPQKKLDEKEKQQLERRYQLPDTPHIIVHPSKTAKSGKFDCTVMSLSVLLDYRLEDTKERSFEVSLFAELFNEMLMRDFGFNIYKEIVLLPEKAKEKDEKDKEENKSIDAEVDDKLKDTNEKRENNDREKSRERRMSDSERSDKKSSREHERRTSKRSYDDDTEDDDYSIKSGDRRKKTKAVVAKPDLLLSFVYFDTTHCGYIFEKDLEDLFFIIGLNLSRAQVRKLLNKVISRDVIFYRKLTDKTKEDEGESAGETIEQRIDFSIDTKKLARGNKRLIPVFKDSSDVKHTGKNSSEEENLNENSKGMVVYNGGLLDIGKLVEQMKRSEKAREDIEQMLTELRKQNSDLQNNNNKANNKIKDLQAEAKSLSRKLSDAEKNISSLNKKYNEYYSILSSIYDKVSPIFVKSERTSRSEGSRENKDKDRERDREREREKDKEDSKEAVKTEIKKEQT